MKTVSGKVLSCKPVSISKAAKVLSKFVSTDNGASPAFAAYLRRASASLSELAQLHKEQKSSGSRHKVKKQHSHSTVTEGMVESVITRSKDGLLAKESSTSKRKEVRGVNKSEGEAKSIEVEGETKRHKSKNREEEDEGKHNARGSAMKMEVQESDGIADGNAEIVREAGKKSKIKRENSESGAVTIKDQPCSDYDGINSSELKNKETKKKKKRDSLEIGRHDVASDIKEEVLKDEVDAQAIENEKCHSGKKKKHKKDQHHGDHAAVNSTEVKNEVESFDGSKDGKKEKKRDKPEKEKSDDPSDMEKEKKQKKKRSHEERDIEHEGKLEVEAANNRQRKRKHESVVEEGLENSQEKHKSKKKKR
ncbi:nucleolar protein 58-like [Chenopodium quinoa]|uniref:nucleolar protein 58-like n=1 Tax=Chenopodium quinoa TaxID=63459 RepID=UPI000B787EC3|nr:nucleolar protein 58-like [Chenopodium quinoa]